MSILNLYQNGRSDYVIVPDASDPCRFAATELQKYFRLTGKANLPIAVTASGPGIYLHRTGAEGDRDRYVLRIEGRDIWITGSNSRSVLFGVYAFMERFCGVRFFAPDFECIPSLDRLEVPRDLRIEQTADFAVRTLRAEWTINVTLVDWAAKNRFNGFSLDPWHWAGEPKELAIAEIREAVRVRGIVLEGSGHSMCFFLPSKKYFDVHPEWYPEVEGRRVRGVVTGDNFCYSNPEAVEECAENVVAFLRQFPEMARLSIWPGDGGAVCRCDRCRLQPFMVLYGNAVKRIRQRVQSERPEVEIFQEAYNFDNRERPFTVESTTRTLRVPPEYHDLPTLFAFWGQNLSIPLADNPDPGHRRFYDSLQNFCGRNSDGAYIFSMHTDTFMLSNLCPVFGASMAADFREFKRLGIDRMFLLWITWNTENEQNMEWVGFQNGAFWARTAEDMGLNAMEYRREYCRWAFGDSQAERGEILWNRLNAALDPLQAMIYAFPWNRPTDAWGLGWNRKVPQCRWQLTTDLGEKGPQRTTLFGQAAAELEDLWEAARKLSDADLPECRRFKKYVEHCTVRTKGLSLLFKAQAEMQSGRWTVAEGLLRQAMATGMTDEREETAEWLEYVRSRMSVNP